MPMTQTRFSELVALHGGRFKDFSQAVYMLRFGKPELVAGGMCRALASAYVVKNHAKALGGMNPDADEFAVMDFTRDLTTEKFFSALAMGRQSVTASEINAWPEEEKLRHGPRFTVLANVHIQTASKVPPGSGPAAYVSAERQTVVKAVDMISKGRMKYVSEVPIEVKKPVTTSHFPDRQGFWVVTAMGHAIAVCFRAGPKAKVFEPNFGQGVFDSYEHSRSFLTQFVAEDEHYAEYGAKLFAKEFSS